MVANRGLRMACALAERMRPRGPWPIAPRHSQRFRQARPAHRLPPRQRSGLASARRGRALCRDRRPSEERRGMPRRSSPDLYLFHPQLARLNLHSHRALSSRTISNPVPITAIKIKSASSIFADERDELPFRPITPQSRAKIPALHLPRLRMFPEAYRRAWPKQYSTVRIDFCRPYGIVWGS